RKGYPLGFTSWASLPAADKALPFRCVDGCSVCCVIRDYPRIYAVRDLSSGRTVVIDPRSLGKEGMVELEAWEMPKIAKLARKLRNRVDEKGNRISYRFLPAWGLGPKGAKGPDSVISYWLMGRDEDGEICPFLSTEAENSRTANGTLRCLIYEERPLQCRAYPVHAVSIDKITGEKMVELDQGCQWVMEMEISGESRVAGPFPQELMKEMDYGAFARLQSESRIDPRANSLWVHPTGVFERGEKPGKVFDGWMEIPPG
ncbi:MAG TPA: YkgJ family cysteine cluster protein, partial [Conexivisphaerales archaeon]|nr:YkgJ family cysteine cluster protein [Conexivisphaerales archaeon]